MSGRALFCGLPEHDGYESALPASLVGRSFLPAELPMFTGRCNPDVARGFTESELDSGRLVQVCSKCQTPELKDILAGLPNVSHGYCRPCCDAEIAAIDAQIDAAKKARAA